MASSSFTSPFQTSYSKTSYMPFVYGHCKPLDASFSFSAGSIFSSYSGRRMMFIQHRQGKIVALSASKPAKEAAYAAEEEEQTTNARRVVVTGMGLVTPLGDQVDEFYNNLLQGVSGVSEIESFDATGFSTRIAAEVKSFSPDAWVSPKLSKRTEKNIIYTIASGKKALQHGGVTQEDIDISRCGVVIGSAIGGLKMSCEGVEKSMISWKKVNPFTVPFSLIHMGSALLATELGWMGPNYAVSTACATSNSCIMSAADHILRGEADMMLCGGSESVITPLGLSGFVACGTLSERNDDPTRASRPWDKNRDGFVMGEGAGVLLLEDLEHAKKRGAKIYAEFLGGSSTNDAYDMTKPHPTGDGLILCMKRALAQSGLMSNDINYVNAHATSTVAGDSVELMALHKVFEGSEELRINATKSMTGHLMGGSGAVEAIAVVKAIETGWIHPNLNLEDTDDTLNWGALVGDKKERLEVKAAMSNSFGFGGHNACIVFAPLK